MFGIGSRKHIRAHQTRTMDINKGSDTRIKAHVKNRKPQHIKARPHTKVKKASTRYPDRGHLKF